MKNLFAVVLLVVSIVSTVHAQSNSFFRWDSTTITLGAADPDTVYIVLPQSHRNETVFSVNQAITSPKVVNSSGVFSLGLDISDITGASIEFDIKPTSALTGNVEPNITLQLKDDAGTTQLNPAVPSADETRYVFTPILGSSFAFIIESDTAGDVILILYVSH